MDNAVVYGVFILTLFLFQTEGTRFKAGERYEYRYEVLTSTGVNSTYAAGTKLSCTLVIAAIDQDQPNLQVKKCRVEERSAGNFFTKSEQSDSFSEEISRNAISFHFVDGEVVNHQIVIPEIEQQNIVNVKRGIVSLLQVPSTARNPSSKSYIQDDILGGCKADIKFPEKSENHVQTHRDLVTCRLAHIRRGQSDFTSFIKTLKGGAVLAPITQMTYQFDSDVTCDYFMGNYQQLKQARCLQRQAYLPFAHEDLNQNIPMTNISQTLKLLSRTKLGSNEIMEPLAATRAVDLIMDFSANIEEEYDRNLLERHFRAALMDVLGQGHDIQTSATGDAAQSFRRLINTMRRMVYDELKPLKDGILACRNSTLCYKDFSNELKNTTLKSVSEQILTNALMSCGTHACVDVLAECLRDRQIGDAETQIILFNTALFYDPSARFIQNIFELCKINNRTTCLLSLSALLGRLKVSQEAGTHKLLKDKMIFGVVSHLHQMIGDHCPNGCTKAEMTTRDELLLTALKALGNIGRDVHTFYNSLLDEGNKLTDDLLQCLMNKEVSVIVARTTIQTINRIGLNATICQKLFNLLSDEKRPVVIRASIFDILLFYGDGVMLNDLLDLLDTTKMDHMRTYILSRLSGLLEDLNPHHQNLRISLRELLKKRVITELSDNDFDQSHFTQLSHVFTVPLTSLNLWGSLAFKIIYTPTSNLFQSITIKADWELNDTTKVNMFEVIVDVNGMDSFIAYLIKSNITDWREIFKFLHHTNIHEAKFPQFSYFRQTVLKNLQKIFKTSNFQGAEMPQGFLSFKINGLDVGWLTSDSLSSLALKVSKNFPVWLMGHLSHTLDIFFTRAVNVLEIHQILPTAAGLPFETLIDFNLVFKSIIQKKLKDFGSLESFNIDFIFKHSVSVFIQRSMQVSLMRYTKSRISLKSSGLVSLDLSTNFKYQARQSQWDNQNVNPESRRDNHNSKSSSNGEFKIQMLWALGNEQVNFVNIKNDIYLKHNVNEIRLVPITREYQYVNCLPDVYTAALGRRVCFTGSYYSPASNVIEGILSSISPFRMEASIVPDDENLKHYLVAASWHRDLGSSSFQFKLVLEAPGTELSRLVNITVSTDRFGSIKFECKIPDVEIKCLLERKLFFNSTHNHHRYAVVLSQDKKTLSSFVFERKGYFIPKSTSLPDQTQVKFDQSSTDVHVNLNLGDVSLDLRLSGQRPLATYWEKTLLLKYFCEPSLKLLYSLHPVPSLAKNEGHTSSFSYRHEIMDSMTPLEKTWMAFYKVVVIWPDNNITMTTTMAGDTKRAHRLTDVSWKYGDQMDLIKMVSDVTNKSTEQTGQYDYILHLSNRGKFDLDLVGHLQSSGRVPSLNWSIQTDVRYMEKGGNNRKAKTWWSRWWQSKISDFDDKEKLSVEKHDKRKELYFWRQPTWSFGIDVSVQMTPHKATTPVAVKMTREGGTVGGEGGKVTVEGDKMSGEGDKMTGVGGKMTVEGVQMTGEGGKMTVEGVHMTGEGGKMIGEGGKMSGEGGKMTGVEFHWLINASLPRGGPQLFKTKGKVVNEIKKWMSIDLEDNIHDLMFNWKAENMMTPKVFHHQHNWTLVDTSQHTFDRSFNLRVDFEHYQHLEYDVALVTPRLNFTHHINYTKMSEGQHRVRAHIDLVSTSPKFHLLYFESTDINGTYLTTKINLTSQLLNYKLELMRRNGTFKGDLTADGMFLKTEKRLSLFLVLPSTNLPRCEMMYFYDGSSALRLDISILHLTKVRLELHSLSAGVIHNSPMKLINLALELTEPRILLTNLEVSNLVSHNVRQNALTLQKTLSDLVKQGGHTLANNIVADLQDQIWPFFNQSMAGHLKARLFYALSSDFDGKTIRFYKLGLGVVQVLNKIYLDNPIVQLMKISQVDEAMALTVTFVSQIVSRWVRHPPFFVRQFINAHVSPSLQTAVTKQQLNSSICLSVSLPAINVYPRLGSTTKEVMTLLKHRTIMSSQMANDVGIIMAGRHVRTFDGKFYDLMEPHLKSCTYLVVADLKNGKFFVTYTLEGLTVVSSNTEITLARDGSLSSVGSEAISSLPYSSSSGNITLKMIDGYFNLSFASGLATVIFSPCHDFYIVTIDRSLNNVSLGILGTNNRETGDDYLLPSGTLAENDVTFQNSYELTGNKRCRLVSTISRANSCNPPNMTMDLTPCTSLTDQWSTVIPCLKLINPKPFIKQCLIDVSLKRPGCNVVLAYLTACRSKGLDFNIPHSCSCADIHGADRHGADRHGADRHCAERHRAHSHGADRHRADRHGADIVFIQSLHYSLISSHQSLAVFKRLSSSLPNTDLNVGLVTYGGDGQSKHPKAHILNGKLLEKWKLLSDDLTVDIETGQKHVRPNEAIMAAANFPFRSSAAKFIMLAYEHEVNSKDNDDKLQLLLKDKGITLVAVSSHPALLTSQVAGIMSNGQVIGEETYLPLPRDAYSHLVLATGGMWLNLDTIIAGHVKQIQHMANQLEKLQMSKSQHQCN